MHDRPRVRCHGRNRGARPSRRPTTRIGEPPMLRHLGRGGLHDAGDDVASRPGPAPGTGGRDSRRGTAHHRAFAAESSETFGDGYVITLETEYRNPRAETVGTKVTRVLQARPTSSRPDVAVAVPDRPKRPRPSMNADSAWFWEGCNADELRVQTFADGTKVFPPMVRNPRTGEMPVTPQWTVASGSWPRSTATRCRTTRKFPRSTIRSSSDSSNSRKGCASCRTSPTARREQLQIGMPLDVCWLQADDDTVLPQFRPAAPRSRTDDGALPTTSTSANVCPPRPLALGEHPGIAPLSGLSHRYLAEWAGPDAVLRTLELHVDAGARPNDTVTFAGTIDDAKVTRRRRPRADRVHRQRSRRRRAPRPCRARVAPRRTGTELTMAITNYAGTTAIAGIGATAFTKDSGRTPMQLAVEACEAAHAPTRGSTRRAGRRHGHVLGRARTPRSRSRATSASTSSRHFSRIHHGGGAACGTIEQAALAVRSGQADYVLVLPRVQRALGASLRHRRAGPRRRRRGRRDVQFAWTSPFGLLTPASWVAMFATRYMHEYGATSRGLRSRRGGRPQARGHEPEGVLLRDARSPSRITRTARWIVEPLHLLDCCQESDGGQAILVTTPERAKDLPERPAVIAAAAQGAADGPADDAVATTATASRGCPRWALRAPALEHHAGSAPPTSRRRSSTTTSRRSCSRSSRSSASASAARRRTSSRTATSSSAAGCRSTPTAASSARPTSTA